MYTPIRPSPPTPKSFLPSAISNPASESIFNAQIYLLDTELEVDSNSDILVTCEGGYVSLKTGTIYPSLPTQAIECKGSTIVTLRADNVE